MAIFHELTVGRSHLGRTGINLGSAASRCSADSVSVPASLPTNALPDTICLRKLWHGLCSLGRRKVATTQTVPVPSVALYPRILRLVERYFYFAISLLITAVVVYGFTHTIERKLTHANPRPPLLLWLHVVLFSGWLVFYTLQSVLVRIRKLSLHRTLGWAGATLGASMIVVGPWTAVVMARFDIRQLHRANRDAFLIVPLFDIFVFASCLGLAIFWRNIPERHRRLMLIATCALTGAAFGRMPLMHSPLAFYGGIDTLILLGAVRDFVVNRRIHTVYLVTMPLLVAAQVIVAQIFLNRAAFWLQIAHALLN